jgi:polar amino acid transport system substrate-binding protein
LRAAINLGNPVLAQGTPSAPTGVTVEIAQALAERLGVAVELLCVDAARKSFEAIAEGTADLCFLAIEPARQATVSFTAPYAIIDGVFVVPEGSTIATSADVDRQGIRVGVRLGSAYDLFLSRTLERATLVRSDEDSDLFDDGSLDVAAGVRQPMTQFVATNPGFRLLDGHFMEIRQALGVLDGRDPEAVRFLHDFVEELKRSGFVARALRRANQLDVAVAPPA